VAFSDQLRAVSCSVLGQALLGVGDLLFGRVARDRLLLQRRLDALHVPAQLLCVAVRGGQIVRVLAFLFRALGTRRIVADLSHTHQALQQAQQFSRRQAQKLEALQPIEQRNGMLAAQLIDKDPHAQALQAQLTAALAQTGSLSTQVRDLELVLAQGQAKNEAQQGIVAEVRTYLVASERPA